jgi:DUF2075 family protein
MRSGERVGVFDAALNLIVLQRGVEGLYVFGADNRRGMGRIVGDIHHKHAD